MGDSPGAELLRWIASDESSRPMPRVLGLTASYANDGAKTWDEFSESLHTLQVGMGVEDEVCWVQFGFPVVVVVVVVVVSLCKPRLRSLLAVSRRCSVPRCTCAQYRRGKNLNLRRSSALPNCCFLSWC